MSTIEIAFLALALSGFACFATALGWASLRGYTPRLPPSPQSAHQGD